MSAQAFSSGTVPRKRACTRLLGPMVAGAALFASVDAAEPAGPMYSALEAVLATNPEIETSRLMLQQTRQQTASVARARLFPSVQVSGSTGSKWQEYEFTGLFRFEESGTVHPVQLQAYITQSLYRGGRTFAEIDAADASVGAESERLRSLEQRVLGEAAKIYMEVATDREIERLLLQDVTDARQILGQVELQFASGGVTRTDVHQAQSRLQQSMGELAGASARLAAAEADYERIIGTIPLDPTIPAGMVELPATLAAALDAALLANPDLLVARYDLARATNKLRSVRGELLPSVDLQLGYQLTRDGYIPDLGTFGPKSIEEASALVTMTVPLFQREVYARISATRFEQRAAQSRVRQLEDETQAEVRRSWAMLLAARQRGRHFQAAVISSGEALDGVRLEQKAGARTVLDVLNAERNQLDARVALATSTFESAAAQIDLATRIGLFTLDRLRTVDAAPAIDANSTRPSR